MPLPGDKKIRAGLLLAGIILVLLSFVAANIPPDQKPAAKPALSTGTPRLVTSFSAEPLKLDSLFLTSAKNPTTVKDPPVRLVVPSLTIDVPVREARIIGGYWEVFPDAAGFGLGSAYPQDSGNQVIFAHARKGLFGPLRDIKQGADITVFTRDRWYSYRVTAIREVLPNQTEVIAPTKEAVLTLYTCTGFADSKRLIVVAERNSI